MPFPSTFPTFVPSLSWQNDRLDINQLQKESFSAPTLLFQRILCGNVRRTLTVKGRVEKVDELVRHMAGTEHGPAKTKHTFYWVFPVLVPSLSWKQDRFVWMERGEKDAAVFRTSQSRQYLQRPARPLSRASACGRKGCPCGSRREESSGRGSCATPVL